MTIKVYHFVPHILRYINNSYSVPEMGHIYLTVGSTLQKNKIPSFYSEFYLKFNKFMLIICITARRNVLFLRLAEWV
jgi:hypothetical protein